MNKNALATASSILLVFAAFPLSAQETAGAKPATAGGAVPKQLNVSQEQLVQAGGDARNWLHTEGNYAQTRYNPGAQINPTNVAKLRPAFVFQTEVVESMETAPIVVEGVMYITTSYNHVYALDAATGKEYWHYKHKMRSEERRVEKECRSRWS